MDIDTRRGACLLRVRRFFEFPVDADTDTGTLVSIVSGSSNLTTTAYSPNPVTVSVGGTVTWMNNDNTAHTSTANGGAFDSATIAPGASFSRTFPTAGSFPYHCTLHPGNGWDGQRSVGVKRPGS